jgi:hypothetical protein
VRNQFYKNKTMNTIQKISLAIIFIVILIILVVAIWSQGTAASDPVPTPVSAPVSAAVQHKTFCENAPISISCPTGTKLQIDQFKYYRPEGSTCDGVDKFPTYAGHTYTETANALIVHRTGRSAGVLRPVR